MFSLNKVIYFSAQLRVILKLSFQEPNAAKYSPLLAFNFLVQCGPSDLSMCCRFPS